VSDLGRLLIVTGSTGSGKTTTCKEFVAQMDDLWLHFGVDLFLGTVVPRKFVDGGPRSSEGVHMEPDDPAAPDGPRHLALGRHGPGMIRTFHQMAAAAVRSGQNVVLDHVTTISPPLLQDCVATLRDLPVFFVGLRPPDEIIPNRIDERLESIVQALGREHAARANENTKLVSRYMSAEIFSHDHFDLLVDTHAHAPQEVVRIIAREMADRPGRAFAELARKLDAGVAPFDR
jgi:chloramphenicol 3-O-phosphotransferase